jgi:hypothetical protein
MAAALAPVVERATPRSESRDGEQEVGGLRRIDGGGYGLRAALGRDEAGVASFPPVELPVEEYSPRRVIRQRREMSIHAGDETRDAVGDAAVRLSCGAVALAIWRQYLLPVSDVDPDYSYTM